MKYKVDDRVIVKSLDWYKRNNKGGDVFFNSTKDIIFIDSMAKYCGKNAIITECKKRYYNIDIDGNTFSWIDEMFDDIKQVRKEKLKKIVDTNEI